MKWREREKALNKWIVKMTRYTWQLNGDFFPIRVCVSLFFRYISFHFEPYHFHKINLVFHLIFLSSKHKCYFCNVVSCYSLFRFLFKKRNGTKREQSSHNELEPCLWDCCCVLFVYYSLVERWTRGCTKLFNE